MIKTTYTPRHPENSDHSIWPPVVSSVTDSRSNLWKEAHDRVARFAKFLEDARAYRADADPRSDNGLLPKKAHSSFVINGFNTRETELHSLFLGGLMELDEVKLTEVAKSEDPIVCSDVDGLSVALYKDSKGFFIARQTIFYDGIPAESPQLAPQFVDYLAGNLAEFDNSVNLVAEA